MNAKVTVTSVAAGTTKFVPGMYGVRCGHAHLRSHVSLGMDCLFFHSFTDLYLLFHRLMLTFPLHAPSFYSNSRFLIIKFFFFSVSSQQVCKLNMEVVHWKSKAPKT